MLKSSGARSIAVIVVAALLASCGGSSKPITVSNGTLFSFVGDTPVCDVLSFRVLIAGSSKPAMSLRIAGTSNTVTVIPTSAAIRVNFGMLKDFSTVLSFVNIPAGTYDQATILMSGPELAWYDPTQSPPIKTMAATLPSTPPAIPIVPNLVVNGPVNGTTQVSGLQIDFNLPASVELDSSGNVTGNVTPVMTATPVTPSTQGFSEVDGVLGFIQRVDTFSSNTNFTGDLALQLLSGTGPSMVVNLTTKTMLCGPATTNNQPCTSIPLNQILTASFAAVDGYVDPSGNFVADSVDIEDQENLDTANKMAFLGTVVSTTKDASGNVTKFSLYVADEEPNNMFTVPLDTVVVVYPSSSTIYDFSSQPSNFTNLGLDQTGISVGQQVIVHGVFTAGSYGTTTSPTTVAADKVYLALQVHQGNFSSLVQAGSDDKTGAFWLAPCSTMFNKAPILVLTNSQTHFVNVAGLNEITPQPTLLVKGLLFYDLKGGTVTGSTINNVTVPAGTLVLVAKQVHQTL